MAALIVNPRKRKAKRRSTKRYSMRTKARRRSNPAKRGGMVDKTIMPALIGGVGAVGANIAFKYVAGYLPAEVQTGNMKYVAEGAFILLAGMALDKAKIGEKKTRDNFVQGALAVSAFRLIDNVASSAGLLPTGVSGYQNLMGYQSLNGMGYMNTSRVYQA